MALQIWNEIAACAKVGHSAEVLIIHDREHRRQRLKLGYPNNGHEAAPAVHRIANRPTDGLILLVEHRDEVYARIAADLEEIGMEVVRATTGATGLGLHKARRPTLVIANVQLTDQSGWLFTAKLRIADRGVPVWLYQSRPAACGMAEFLGVAELFAYGGDLLDLSRMILNRFTDNRHSLDTGFPSRFRLADGY